MIPPKRFEIFSLAGGCSEGLDAFRFFFTQGLFFHSFFLRAFSTVAASLAFVLYCLVAWHGDQCSKCTVQVSWANIFAAYVKQQI